MRGSGLRRSGNATYRTEHQRTTFRGRRPYHTTCRLCGEPAERKRIEEPFGWARRSADFARPMLRGVEKLGFKFTLTMAGYNLIRLPKLIAAQA